MQTRDEYLHSLEADLKEWSVQIELLAAKTEAAEAQLKLKYLQELNAIQSKQFEATKKIKQLQDASTDSWESLKDTADTVWDEIRTGINSTIAIFK